MNPKYATEVNRAIVLMMTVDLTNAERPEDIHPRVKEATSHLRRACRMYRRHRVGRRLLIFSEEYAVSLGMLTQQQVDKL